MQLSAPFFALVATVILSLSSVNARPFRRNPSGMITLPVRRVQRNEHIHVELVSTSQTISRLSLVCMFHQRHQQHLNRAERLVARAAGIEGPSDSQLRANLERRASLVEERFNIPPPGFGLPAGESDETVSNVVVANDVYALFSPSFYDPVLNTLSVPQTALPRWLSSRLKSIPSRFPASLPRFSTDIFTVDRTLLSLLVYQSAHHPATFS